MLWKDNPDVKALIQETADRQGVSYVEAERAIESVFESADNAMKAGFEKIMIWKFGSFLNKEYHKRR